MCWNAEVSIFTFLTSVLMSGHLWRRHDNINDRPLAIFIAWVALMQLFEYFMWRNMAEHSLASKLAYITTILQPFVLAASLYYFYYVAGRLTDGDQRWYYIIMVASALQAGAAIYYAFVTANKTAWLSVPGPHSHLIWWYKKYEANIPFPARVDQLYFATLICAVLLIKSQQALVYLGLMLGSFFLTQKFYPLECGSLWCWVVNLIGMLAIFIPYLKSPLK